ncbi:MAG TPA: hypothetical protein VFL85_00800 [Candidatus Saccharimonadales bacterium]|nr:hypothetical protein [Candidatus Saccharimonadales bacterium]
MTRVLSELLGAKEPMFHRGVEKLESASGHNSTDIRLSSEINRGVQRKLHDLGLDPKDTTGEELYQALAERLKADDERLLRALREKFGDDKSGTITQVASALRQVPVPRSVYALKTAVAKRVLKKIQPKHVMKRLGYRSFDSMLKHEQPATLLAAAWLVETAVWHKQMLEQYRKLKASDFELRTMAIVCPDTKRWADFATELVHEKRHTVLPVKELGTVVLLPLPAKQPPAATTVTLLLALHVMNDVRAASTFLKLCQVKPDFGQLVGSIVAEEPALDSSIFERPVPWQIIQRYYARFSDRFRGEVFEPHVQADDLAWHSIERILTYIEPSMEFWRHTANLSLLHNHQPVSMNIIDVALNYCNGLPYRNRIVRYFQHSLWHELLIRYLKHERVEQSVLAGLNAELVDEPVLI